MDGIGSIGALAMQAAQSTYSVSSGGSVAAPDTAASTGDASGAASSPAFSADYAMTLLARITHASADQALALIQALSPTPLR